MFETRRTTISLLMFLTGCIETTDCSGFTLSEGTSGSTPAAADGGAAGRSPYQEVYDGGLLRYAGGEAVIPSSVTTSALFPKIAVHRFENGTRRPLCMRGDEFFVETREGASDELMVFLEGGGVCLDEICAATVKPMLSLRALSAADIVGINGLLDATDDRNPVADADVVHAPYCDGSIFLGDVDRVLSDGNALNGTNDMAYQRGLLNLTATFEVAKRTHPTPSRLLLVGTSGGSYGTLLGVAMARHYYPSTPIFVVSDSGAPILTDQDPGFVASILEELGGAAFLPPSCPDCITNGHTTGVVAWALARDPQLSFAYLGHARDHVIGEFFMHQTADRFSAAVARETTRLVTEFPGRAFRFVVPGRRHTLALDVATAPDGLQRTVIGVFGSVALTGDDVTSAELSTWTLGGMQETGRTASGESITGYAWLKTVLRDPAHAVDVLDLGD